MTLGRQEIDPARAAPEDEVAAAVHALLAANADVQSYFDGERNVMLYDVPPPPDYTPGKALIVFPSFTGEPLLAPGEAGDRDIRIMLRIRRQVRSHTPSRRGQPAGGWPIAVPGVATIAAIMIQVLYDAKGLPQTIGGQEVDIVSPGHTRAEPTTWQWEELIESPGFFAINFDTAVTFRAEVDHKTGRIRDVVKAGG